MTVYKTYDAIRQNYYVPNLYKKFNNYTKQCVACQTRNFKKGNPKKKKETEIILIISLRLHWTCLDFIHTFYGNKYIVLLIVIYSGWHFVSLTIS